ncbi:FAD-binding protein [Pygmaiobacter massiliensis]|uniref:FAD-binding protein n=1 Tax=Pygmaiobacter massiliensis TaxID=1917873 RepID=UPI0015E13D26|nr:FAD-binding protein [Pygmaiobacter massiliensis]
MLKVAEKIFTDVLVVGGGGAACTAAVAAARNGAKVALVSKGKTGNSGNTIMIGGSYGMDGESAYHDYHIEEADPTFTKEEMFKSIVNDGFNLSDQNLVEQFIEESPRIVYEVKEWGEEIGEKFRFYAPANWDVTGRSMGRALLAGVKKTPGVSIYDDVAIVELLKNGEQVTGALGIELYTGRLLQFEAKATILGTGGFQPYTLKNTNTDMTGDGQAMAYRAGAKLADMEFMLFLMSAIEPNNMRGSILPAICTFRRAFNYDPVDCNGDKIEVPEALREMEATSEMSKLVHMFYFGRVINQGRGSKNGGIYFDFSRFTDEEIDTMFDAVMEHFDGFYRHGYYHGESVIEYREMAKKKRKIEVGLSSEYSVGGIFIDENMFTGVPGLYAAGEVASGAFGANRVADAVTEMIVQGYKAGEVAAQRTAAQELVGTASESVEQAVGMIQSLLDNDSNVTVGQLLHQMETVTDDALGMVRNQERLEKGLDIYHQLDEAVEKVVIHSKSLVYNRELMQALQVKNLVTCSRVATEMALARKESRGLHLREDYPYIDNVDWQVRLLAHCEDGKDILEKKVPDVTKIPLRKPEKIDYESFILEEDLGMKNLEEK